MGRIGALNAASWISRLRMQDVKVPKNIGSQSEIWLFCLVRNEILRLPFFFEHYRKSGVDRFVVVDNGSTDGSFEFVCDQADTVVFSTRESFARNLNWRELVLNRFGQNRWCVMVDIDDMLVFRNYESSSIPELVGQLESAGANPQISPKTQKK